MAKITIEIDTSAKVGTVSVDGTEISDVKDVSVSFDPNYFYFELYKSEEVGEDLRQITRLVANDKGDLEEKESVSQASQDISKVLASQWCISE